VRKPHEHPAIGFLLCASKDAEVVEYALSDLLQGYIVAGHLALDNEHVIGELDAGDVEPDILNWNGS